MTGLFLAVILAIITNTVRSEEPMAKDWQIVEGSPIAWDFQAEGIRCEVANDGLHRILSEQIIKGDWIIEAEIECLDNYIHSSLSTLSNR